MNFFGVKFSWKLILLGLGFSPLLQFINKYIFSDWQFIIWVFLLVALDTFTGVWKAWKTKTISSKSFAQVISKLTVYGIFLIVLHALGNFTVNKISNTWFGWVDNIGFSTIMIREAISIFENLAIISPDVFPKKILTRLHAIDDTIEGSNDKTQN